MKKAILFLYIFCAFLQFSIAQTSPLDSSLVHPLRVLGERSSSADPYVQQNNTGIENKSVQELKDAAMALVGVIPANIAADFKVYDYAAYAIVGQMKDPDKQNEKVFNAMDSIIRTVYNVQSYFLIGKEINATDGKVKFRVKLNLPLSGNKPNLDDDKSTGGRSATIFDEINEELLTELNTEILSITNSKNTSTSVDSKKQEKIALKATKYYLTGDRLRAKEVEVPKESQIWASGITPDNKAIVLLPYNILPDKHKFVYIITPDNFTIRALAIYKEENNEKTKVHEYKWENGEFVDAFDDGVSFVPLNVTISETATYAQAWQFDNNDNCFLRTQYIKFSQGNKPNSVAEIKDKVIDSAWEYSLQYTANQTCLANFLEKTTAPFDCFGDATLIANQKLKLEQLFQNISGKLIVNEDIFPNIISNTINKSCKSALKSLGKEKILTLFEFISTSEVILEPQELAILRLMASLETKEEYKDFYLLLEKKYVGNRTIFVNLIHRMTDFSVRFWIDQPNYTNFITALIWMYKTNPSAIENRLPNIGIDPKQLPTKEEEKTLVLSQVLNLGRKVFKDDLLGQTIYRNYKGVYNSTNGSIDLYEVTLVTKIETIKLSTFGMTKNDLYNSDRKLTVVTDFKEELISAGINPLTPIFIDFESDLPLVQTAMEAAETNQYHGKLVPAIFFKFNDDKITNDLIEKGVMTTFDVVTIFASGGAALATKIGWARRLWALAEVGGAVGNIALSSGAVSDPKFKGAINAYNAIVGLIGLKNVAVAGYKGLKSLASSGLPSASARALNAGTDLAKDAELLEAYQQFKKEVDAIGDVGNEKSIKDAILEQEKLLDKLMGAANALDDDFIKFFGAKGITVTKADDIVSFSKNNTKILELKKENLKVLDEANFQMDDITGYQNKKMEYIKEVEIDGVKYQTEGVEMAVDANGKIICSGNGTYCFAQDTPLPDGSLMAEKTEGDLIIAYDTEKNTTTQAKISKIRRSFTSAFTRLWIAGTMLSVTPAHALQKISSPLERSGEDWTWVAAGQLHAGDHIRSINGIVTLDSTFTESVAPTPVISYEVEGGLDYVVGEMPVVVGGSCKLKTLKAELGNNFVAFQAKVKDLKLTSTERGLLYDDFLSGNQNLKSFLQTEDGLKAWKGLAYTSVRTNSTWLNRTKIYLNEGMTISHSNGRTLIKNAGAEIAEIKNGQLLPTSYSSSGGTAVGDITDGYQVFKSGNTYSVRRVPDTAPYSPSELTELTQHPDAHVLERHGHDVSMEALNKRATNGVAPDGSTTFSGNPPSHSSKFNSAQRLKDALAHPKPGTTGFTPPATGNTYVFDFPATGQDLTPFGFGIPAGGGSPVQMHRVKIVYKKDGGIWKINTMYPQL